MIELGPELIVGRGLHREVYQHPDHPNLCLKVRVNRGEEEERREQGYYRLLQKRGVPWDGLPRFHGNVDTTLGQGALFDLIRDDSGEVSKTLEYYFSDSDMTEPYQQTLVAALQALRQYLLCHNILTMSLKPKNIVLQLREDEHSRCVIVDNIGNSDWIPLGNWVPLLGRRKIERKWQDFRRRLIKEHGNNRSVIEIVSSVA